MSESQKGAVGQQSIAVTSGEGEGGQAGSLTPFELAIAFPGFCGKCGKAIDFTKLFCEPKCN